MPEDLIAIIAAYVVGIQHQLSSLGSRYNDKLGIVKKLHQIFHDYHPHLQADEINIFAYPHD